MPTTTRDALDQLAIQLIVHSSRFVRRASQHTGESRSLVAMRVLSNLQQEGPLRIGELARRELVTQPAMTSAVNRLEEDGLVRRGADPNDARASVVELTADGLAVLKSFRERAAAQVRPGLEQLSDGDVAVLRRATELLIQLGAATPTP